jgi:hypothetical protein
MIDHTDPSRVPATGAKSTWNAMVPDCPGGEQRSTGVGCRWGSAGGSLAGDAGAARRHGDGDGGRGDGHGRDRGSSAAAAMVMGATADHRQPQRWPWARPGVNPWHRLDQPGRGFGPARPGLAASGATGGRADGDRSARPADRCGPAQPPLPLRARPGPALPETTRPDPPAEPIQLDRPCHFERDRNPRRRRPPRPDPPANPIQLNQSPPLPARSVAALPETSPTSAAGGPDPAQPASRPPAWQRAATTADS